MDLKRAALAMTVLAGCASPLDWSKPHATPQAIDADLKACRLAADRVPLLPRLQTAPPSGTGTSTTGSDLDADTQLARAQLVERCMRERGYRLVRK